jgi:hypothetical protein
MKAAILQIAAFVTDPKLILHVLEKGFDIVLYKDPLDGGGVQIEINVIIKKTCLIDFDKTLSSLMEKKQKTKNYVFFWGKSRDNNLFIQVRNIFSDSGAKIVELDISDAETVEDVDAIILKTNH